MPLIDLNLAREYTRIGKILNSQGIIGTKMYSQMLHVTASGFMDIFKNTTFTVQLSCDEYDDYHDTFSENCGKARIFRMESDQPGCRYKYVGWCNGAMFYCYSDRLLFQHEI